MEKLLERFIRYVRVGTASNDKSDSCPSSPGQVTLGEILRDELEALGLSDAAVDANGYVTATIPANADGNIPVIGFIAHLDTSPEMPGDNVNPIITDSYSGGDIILNKEKGVILSPTEFPDLKKYVGQTIISTDGTTLLGADNKAGIAEIVTAADMLIHSSSIKHGTIRLCFTPDEEIGRGATRFDVKNFGAEFAYTVDGGSIGSIEYETFNAATATVKVQGKNIHPGSAKNQMINSIGIAQEFCRMLPSSEKPEYTEGYEGFFHVYDFQGSVDSTSLRMLIRDHSEEIFNARKQKTLTIAKYLNDFYGSEIVTVSIRDEYFNMRKKIEPHMHIVEIAADAVKNCGIDPEISPVRGGTDGSRLSYMGLPCPNIFTGGHNFHGRYEYIPLESMKKAVDVIIEIIKLVALKK